MKNNFVVSFLALLGIFLIACDGKPKASLPFENGQEYKETMIVSHQEFLKKEKERIEEYIATSEHNFNKTGTGLRIAVYESSDKGDSVKTGDLVLINYLLTSIEGDSLYSSPENHPQEFAVDYDNVESGLHEGIKLMKTGDRALLILPAHLAHGITGDQAAISSQTTLVYDIHLEGKR